MTRRLDDDGEYDGFEDEEPDEFDGVSCADPVTHKARVLNAQCATCILRPGNLMHLAPGRLAQLMRDAVAEGTQGMICHDTLPGMAPAGYAPALCRGWFDRYGQRSNFVRVMSRIGGIAEVGAPAPERSQDDVGGAGGGVHNG